MFKKEKPQLVGLDIGSHSLKLLFLDLSGQKTKIIAVADEKITQPESKPGHKEAVIAAIKKITAAKKIKKEKVNLILPSSKVYVRSFPLPSMPQEELTEAVKWTAGRYVAFPVEEMHFDYTVSGQKSAGEEKVKITLIAVKKDIFNFYAELAEKSGLRLNLATATCFALKNTALAAGKLKRNTAIVNTGYSSTDISLFKNEEFVFTRNIPIGQINLWQEISKNIPTSKDNKSQFSSEEIESLIAKADIYNQGSQKLGQNIQANEIVDIISGYVARLTRELELSFSHYRQLSRGSEIKEVILLGGGSKIQGIKKFISQKLNIPVEDLKSENFFQLDPQASKNNPPDSCLYLQALGAGLEKGKNPSLKKTTKKSQKKAKPATPSLFKLAITGASIIFLALLFLGGFNLYQKRLQKTLKNKINSLAFEQAQLEEIKIDAARASARKKFSNKFSGLKPPLEEIFSQLAAINLFENIYITRVRLNSENKQNLAVAEGEVRGESRSLASAQLNQFIEALRAKEIFQNIQPEISQRRGEISREKRTLIDFTLKFELKN